MNEFEEKVNYCITKALTGIGAVHERKYFEESIREFKKLKLMYFGNSEDGLVKVRLLRNLAGILDRLKRNEESEVYVIELYNLLIEDSSIKEYYPLEYCRAINTYTDTFKDSLDKKFIINIERENMRIYKKLGEEFLPDFLTASVNINFLMEDYNSVINLLLKIHTEEEKRIVDLKEQIKVELAEVSPTYYNKYIKLSNMADSLVS
ncbi:MAG: hypothetical protein ACRCX8_06625 [Sarcina sp.]